MKKVMVSLEAASGPPIGYEIANNSFTPRKTIEMWPVRPFKKSEMADLLSEYKKVMPGDEYAENYAESCEDSLKSGDFVLAPSHRQTLPMSALASKITLAGMIGVIDGIEYSRVVVPVYKVKGGHFITDEIYHFLAGVHKWGEQ